jgi:protein SCO1/2
MPPGTLSPQLGAGVPEDHFLGQIAQKVQGRMRKTKSIKSRFAGFILTICVSLLLSSCKHSPKAYTLTGRVISKQPDTQQLIIDNDDIPGFMAAMTMPYLVKDSDGFQRVQPKDVIRADVVVEKPGKFWLEHLTVTGKSAAQSAAEGPTPEVLRVGDAVPDVPMVNQDGKTLHFARFKEKVVLTTFIYTRCPFPDYCPLLSRQFAAIQKELAKNPDDYKKTHLISITLDPNYDKPPVLREYGLSYLEHDPKGFEHWDFVATTPADLQKLTASFGLTYYEQSGLISHAMNTILLAADGTVAYMWPDNEWRASEVFDAMRHASTLSK